MIKFNEFTDQSDMISKLADLTLEKLAAEIEKNGAVTWAVSGGSTPKALFEEIRTRPFAWDKVTIALVDERWVGTDHPRSNETFMRSNLERDESAKATFVGLKADADTPHAALDEVRARYNALPAVGACLLGLGPDGHTASLFPNAEGLEDAMQADDTNDLAAITAIKSDVTGDEVLRMTLNLAAIRRSGWPHLLITGAGKRAALEAAIEGGELPIARVAGALDKPLEVFWAP